MDSILLFAVHSDAQRVALGFGCVRATGDVDQDAARSGRRELALRQNPQLGVGGVPEIEALVAKNQLSQIITNVINFHHKKSHGSHLP